MDSTNRRRRKRQNAAPDDQMSPAAAKHVQTGIRLPSDRHTRIASETLPRQPTATRPRLALNELQARHGDPRRILASIDDVGHVQAAFRAAPAPAGWSAAPPPRPVRDPVRVSRPVLVVDERERRVDRDVVARRQPRSRPSEPHVLGEQVELEQHQAAVSGDQEAVDHLAALHVVADDPAGLLAMAVSDPEAVLPPPREAKDREGDEEPVRVARILAKATAPPRAS